MKRLLLVWVLILCLIPLGGWAEEETTSALYPIREKVFSDGTVALNYHRWDICKCGRDKGKALNLPVYQFLKAPLVRRFGEAWYQELCDVASELKQQGYL